jgi:hypothetical protein
MGYSERNVMHPMQVHARNVMSLSTERGRNVSNEM